jgi:hypothetical protein
MYLEASKAAADATTDLNVHRAIDTAELEMAGKAQLASILREIQANMLSAQT